MRRAYVVLLATLLCQVIFPAPAAAWFGFLDELSGPGPFTADKPFQTLQLRIVCFWDEAAATADRKAVTFLPGFVVNAECTDKPLLGKSKIELAKSNPAYQQEKAARGSVGVNLQSLAFTDKTASPYAGGNEITLFILEPRFSWRIFNEPADIIDAGVGLGVYRFSSDGFDAFSGFILEPARFDIHFPSGWKHAPDRWKRVVSIVSYSFGLEMFPAGFDAGRFGPNASPAKARVISGKEAVVSGGIFLNFAKLFD